MQLFTTILPVLRQRGVIARFFSKNLSLTLRQPELTRRSSLLRTEYLSENSELRLARYPNERQFPPMYPVETRFFSKSYTLSDGKNRYQLPEYNSSLPLQALALLKERVVCKLKQKFDIFWDQMKVKKKLNYQLELPLPKPDERPNDEIRRIYRINIKLPKNDIKTIIERQNRRNKEYKLPGRSEGSFILFDNKISFYSPCAQFTSR